MLFDALDGDQVLPFAQHDLADPDASGLRERIAEHRIRVLAALVGQQVVGLIEVAIVDVLGGHEVGHLHAAVLLDRRGLEVFLGEDDEAALLYS